jgi:hypothetical protein
MKFVEVKAIACGGDTIEREQTQDCRPIYEIDSRSSKPFPWRVPGAAERLAAW